MSTKKLQKVESERERKEKIAREGNIHSRYNRVGGLFNLYILII